MFANTYVAAVVKDITMMEQANSLHSQKLFLSMITLETMLMQQI